MFVKKGYSEQKTRKRGKNRIVILIGGFYFLQTAVNTLKKGKKVKRKAKF